MVESILDQVRALGDELDNAKSALKRTQFQLLEANEKIKRLQGEAVDLDTLHSKLKFLEEENAELKEQLNKMTYEEEPIIRNQLHGTHRRQPAVETISLDSPPKFMTQAIIDQTMLQLKSFTFPFELSGKDLKLIKDKKLEPKESLRFAIQTLIKSFKEQFTLCDVCKVVTK